MSRPARALIDLPAIRHNYRLARQLGGGKAAAIIKANAYGHGAIRVAQALADEADAFGVACIEEALELRESGIHGQPILLLEGVFSPDELDAVDRLNMSITVHTDAQLEWLLQARPQRPLDVFLKLDTGMHRLGFAPARARGLYDRLRACPHVGQITLMTHFARADEVNEDFTTTQLQRFRRAAAELGSPLSMANSAAILAWPDAQADWVRPGIMLYGADPLDQPNAHSASCELP
ncbi:MAG: alanine racemase [Thiolinea sp.]